MLDAKFGILCQNYDENVKNFANFGKSGKREGNWKLLKQSGNQILGNGKSGNGISQTLCIGLMIDTLCACGVVFVHYYLIVMLFILVQMLMSI